MPSNTTINKPEQIIKDGQVIDDSWPLLADTENAESIQAPKGQAIVALEVWQAQPALQERDDIGVWLDNSVDLSAVSEEIIKCPLIAIHFPVFMDGRGFSLARLLRERYGYTGEIRAIGHVIRDQLCYLKRCGFNAFSFNNDVDLQAATASLNDFSEAYQTSVDQPMPLFKRRG
jgi:uncharacterized protein (DUF934 family)